MYRRLFRIVVRVEDENWTCDHHQGKGPKRESNVNLNLALTGINEIKMFTSKKTGSKAGRALLYLTKKTALSVPFRLTLTCIVLFSSLQYHFSIN